jgi:hypothetical protein
MCSSFLKKLALFVVFAMPILADGQIITTFAGTGTAGYSGDGGQATNAQINNPIAIAVDTAGNVYVGEQGSWVVRKITPSGIITTIAGTGVSGFSGDGGPATAAQIGSPTGIVVRDNGDIYIAHHGGYRIRKVNSAGIISTVAGGGTDAWTEGIPATNAQLGQWGIAIDLAGNIIVADIVYNRIRKINTSGIINTIAGLGATAFSGDGGPASLAGLNAPQGICVDVAGNIYIYDNNNLRIRKINTAGIISTIAGTGTAGFSGDGGQATAAQINHGVALTTDGFGSLLIGDGNNVRVRKINLSTGIITTVAGGGSSGLGDGGSATAASLTLPAGICVGRNGNIYIADKNNSRVRMVRSTTGVENTDNAAHEISIYPNPCNGTFNVTINAPIEHIVNVTISNMAGETIYQTIGSAKESVKIALDAPPGAYLVSIASLYGAASKLLIIY